MAGAETDPVAWRAYLAEGNARQARKRIAADVVFRDASDRILLVDPKYKPDWDLPGGMAEANEPPLEAARREVKEELGLDARIGELLCVDWVPPHDPWDDALMLIFDGGVLSTSEINALHLVDGELGAYQFCTEEEASRLLRPYVWRRVRVALEALDLKGARYLQDGRPVG